MKSLALLLVLLIAGGCSKAPKQTTRALSADAATLDALLESASIDRVDRFGGSYGVTNSYYDPYARGFLHVLSSTNRQEASAGSFLTNRHRTILLYSGTQTVATLRYYPAQDVLLFGQYCFRLRGFSNSNPFHSFDREFQTY